MENGSVANFDLSLESSNNYFKSSFARSMALTNTSQSKSLDYVYLDDGATISEESEPDIMSRIQTSTPRKPRRSVPALPTYDPSFPRDYSFRRNRTNDAIKFWKMKQESAMKQAENSWANKDHTLVTEESREEEILRLRKECQGLMEANRKLQAGGSSLDSSLLQTQIDTLQWQLKQAESNRQMYRAVMEQVSKFLERVHKALEASPNKGPTRGKSRVPRSRSVHTVVTSQSRASSPSPSHPANVHRANSISQMQDSYSTLRDYTWRGSRTMVEEISPERLSQDAFRLLRTIQSLLGTREPDLARVSEQAHRRDSTSMGSCSSLVVPGVSGCETAESDAKSSTGSTSSASGVTPSGSTSNGTGLITPQPSVSGSTEDESGFSSMSSFHEVTTNHTIGNNGIGNTNNGSSGGGSNNMSATATAAGSSNCSNGTIGSGGSHHELGLPLVSPEHQTRHRRWSSTPVDAGYAQPLRVLWRSRERREVPKYTLQDLPNLC
ncbi:uncharacterized protein isoform X2 [Rhodnius prolixus]|uniref:uncharacterized protein isoform X2 n=1 Tax=Rhodnius prolixus TaxID=13249 RepID=UPI003D188CE5